MLGSLKTGNPPLKGSFKVGSLNSDCNGEVMSTPRAIALICFKLI